MFDAIAYVLLVIITSPVTCFVLLVAPLIYLVVGIVVRVQLTRDAPKAPADGSSPRLARDVHPIIVDALLGNDVLGKHNRGDGMPEWFCACAIHAAGTDGSARIDAVPEDERDSHTRDKGADGAKASHAHDALEGIAITRTAEPGDEVDKALLNVFLPEGDGVAGISDDLKRKLRATPDISEEDIKRYEERAANGKRVRVDRVTLRGLIDELHDDYWSMTQRFEATRAALNAIADRQGLLQPDRFHTDALKNKVGGAIILIEALAGWLIFGNAPGVKDFAIPLYFGEIVIASVTAALIIPWATCLTGRGKEVAATGKHVLAASAEELMCLREEDQLRAACFLATAAPQAGDTIEFARRLGEEARRQGADADDWRLAFALLYAVAPTDLERLSTRDKARLLAQANASADEPAAASTARRASKTAGKFPNAVALCHDHFQSAEIYERD